MLKPDGRVIMVSGANRGIGLAIARCLHEKGYTLSLGARESGALEAITNSFDAQRVMTHTYDAHDAVSNEAWVSATAERFGRIDGLINNAGRGGHLNIEDDDEAMFDEMLAVNTKAPMRMIRLVLPHLRRSGNGRILNVVSLSGKRVANDGTGYAISKFAMMAVNHAARRAAWDDGVRSTALCPGYVNTDMTANVEEVAADDMIQPEDLAEIAAMAIALPNNAVVAEILVNCRFEAML
jgi:NADP-dependent 3-hydroxy acid dehydrogenase YdfG